MLLRPTISTRTDTLLPDPPLFRSDVVGVGVHRDGPGHDVEPTRIALEVVDPGEQVNGRYWCVECRGDVHRKILAQTRGSGRHPAILAFAARERSDRKSTRLNSSH